MIHWMLFGFTQFGYDFAVLTNISIFVIVPNKLWADFEIVNCGFFN